MPSMNFRQTDGQSSRPGKAPMVIETLEVAIKPSSQKSDRLRSSATRRASTAPLAAAMTGPLPSGGTAPLPGSPSDGTQGYMETIGKMVQKAIVKAADAKHDPIGFLVSSALAGFYIAFGQVLIFSVGTPLAAAHSPFLKMIMGISYGIALTLVVFAGSELFLGQNMFMVLGSLTGETKGHDLLRVWGLCYLGNLLGSILFAFGIAKSGVFMGHTGLMDHIVANKMALGFMPALLRGIYCNWLICLALWMLGRVTSDGARIAILFWNLFAFVASGFEQSVGNMSLMAMALFQHHGPNLSWAGYWHNLIPVSLGNIAGGAGLVAGLYWFSSRRHRNSQPFVKRESPVELVGVLLLLLAVSLVLWYICDALLHGMPARSLMPR